MSLYTFGIEGENPAVTPQKSVNPDPKAVVFGPPPHSNFWRFVQWAGAILTVVMVYRETRGLVRKHLAHEEEQEERLDALEAEIEE